MIASSFFRYFPRATNPCALIVYKKLEMNVTKIPVSTNALSSKSKSPIKIRINNRFLSLMNLSLFTLKRNKARSYRFRSSNSSAMVSSSSLISSSSICSCCGWMKYSVLQFGHSIIDSEDFRIQR